MDLRRALVAMCIAWMAPALGACSSDSPTEPESLPQTLATVQAALDLVTTGQLELEGSCAGTTTVNCPGGTLASPAHVNLTRTADTVYFVTGQDRYDFSATLSAVTPAGIPVTFPVVGACTLNIDTSPGTSSTITLTGSARFTSPDRLDVSNLDVTGFEDADASITGSISCAAASFGLSFYVDMLTSMFEQNVSFCAAPGPALLRLCPASAAASLSAPAAPSVPPAGSTPRMTRRTGA